MNTTFTETGNISDIKDYTFIRELVTNTAWQTYYAGFISAFYDLNIDDALLYPELLTGSYGHMAYLLEVDHPKINKKYNKYSPNWGFNINMRPIVPCGAHYRKILVQNNTNNNYTYQTYTKTDWIRINTMDDSLAYEESTLPNKNNLYLFTNSYTSRYSINIFSSWTMLFVTKESAVKYGSWVLQKLSNTIMNTDEYERRHKKPFSYTGEYGEY